MTEAKIGSPSETGKSVNPITLLLICAAPITSVLDFKIMDLGVAPALFGENKYYPKIGTVSEGETDSTQL